MDSKKINLANYIASLEIEGVDKVKQDLKEIEESLDRILSKYEKIAAQEVQVQEQHVILTIDSKQIAKVVIDELREQQKQFNITLIPI